MRSCVLGIGLWLVMSAVQAADKASPDFQKEIAPVLRKYCAGCHNSQDREGKLSLDSYADLLKGGKRGPSVQPGDVKSSRLFVVISGQGEPVMPPKGEEPLKPEHIELIIAWIEAGAKGPEGVEPVRRELSVPKIAPKKAAQQPVGAVAVSPNGKWLAVARYQRVELCDAQSLAVVKQIEGLPGKVNSVEFSLDGSKLIVAAGVPGLYGQASIWNVETGASIRAFEGHRDVMYDAALSPTGTVLATASYDRKIILWDAATGQIVRTLDGHNGAVFDLAFNPDGSILASASADQTIKLWQTSTGVRLDTLSQPLKEQYTVAFSPDGEFVVGGGLDNRLRVWRVVSKEKPRINPMVFARFAHEGAVLRVSFSADGRQLLSASDDKTLKLWDTTEYLPLAAFPVQPEVAPAIALAPDRQAAFVGRIDGSVQRLATPAQAVGVVTRPGSGIVPHSPMTPTVPFKDAADLEPNDTTASATSIELPARIKGAIQAGDGKKSDADLYRFTAKAGDVWVFEVNAARAGSPLDSRIEVLDANGKSVPRVLLQAVRDSYVTFRGIDSNTRDCRLHNWEEMDLNQFVYLNGEVAKLWLWPRGPDSGFVFYPHTGNRQNYFGTSATSHALNEPAYVVEPHAPGTRLLANGLPTFTIYFENDDDPERELGSDSRLEFTAPADGTYFVRIADVRGFQGEKFTYELTARPAAPSFHVKLNGENPSVARGSGREFNLTVDRVDGFEGEIRIDIEGLPPGYSATTPMLIQQGQTVAYGTLNVAADAPAPTAENAKLSKVTATAMINGQEVKKPVNGFGEIKLIDKPKVLVAIHRDVPTESLDRRDFFAKANPLELTIAPGETITAKVHIQRNGFEGRVGFEAIAQNLPHGVIIDNIGLNGLLIVEGQSERQFFITAAPWVPETTRVFHLKANEDGGQTSWPVTLRVKRAN